jgi:hypothetical protein
VLHEGLVLRLAVEVGEAFMNEDKVSRVHRVLLWYKGD